LLQILAGNVMIQHKSRNTGRNYFFIVKSHISFESLRFALSAGIASFAVLPVFAVWRVENVLLMPQAVLLLDDDLVAKRG
jgi:hypothetical protein